MNEDIILDGIENENNVIQEEENAYDLQNTEEIIIFTPENLDISTPFFNGVGISGIMCLMSLGIALIISIFRKA